MRRPHHGARCRVDHRQSVVSGRQARRCYGYTRLFGQWRPHRPLLADGAAAQRREAVRHDLIVASAIALIGDGMDAIADAMAQMWDMPDWALEQ